MKYYKHKEGGVGRGAVTLSYLRNRKNYYDLNPLVYLYCWMKKRIDRARRAR